MYYSYGVPDFVVTDNRTQVISKLFESVCFILGAELLSTTAYHPQGNGKVERFNKTIIPRRKPNDMEHQRNLDIYVQLLTYIYDTQVHRSTGLRPLSLILSRKPLQLTTFESPTALPTNVTVTTSRPRLRPRLLRRLSTM